MSVKDGGPAFPVKRLHDVPQEYYHGMSLRDYFAALVMHAELNTAGAFKGPAVALAEAAQRAGQSIEERIAHNAYSVADAMLRHREKGDA